MIDETEQSPAELAVQRDGECGSKPMAEMEYPDPLYDTEESMETYKKESSNITSPDKSSSISSAKEASKRISEDLHVGSLPKSKQQEEVARKDVKNSPKTKSPKISCKLNDVEGTQKKYLVVSLEKIPDTDIQQPGKSVMKTNYQIHKNTPEVTSMSSADLIKSSEEGIEESVQLTEENMDKFTEEFKTAASQNAHNNNLSSISKQPNIEKVETTSGEFEKDSVPKSKRHILEPKKPRTETFDSHCTESKPLAVTNMETCSSVSEKSEQEKTSKPLSNIQGKGNNAAKAGTGKKVIDFKNFSLDLRALAVQMAKKKQKKN